jgi:pyruvate dehydrogenase E2 component (dihydrolipoamide acetyltransferase)/2-oxoisovalerate dehydrogenase E2 component (dihydrolipoyl transacylase)
MDFALPELGEGVYEAEFVSWRVKVGETVKRGQTLMEVLTDKATMEVPSPFAGTISSLNLEPGQPVKVGDIVLSYEPAGQSIPDRAAPATTQEQQRQEARAASTASAVAPVASAVQVNGGGTEVSRRIKAAPSVRLMARKLGIDLAQITGSGPDHRVLLGDLSRHLEAITRQGKAAAAPQPAAPALNYGTPGGKIKMQGLRRKIAEQMVQSKRTIPHYAYVDECDVTELVRLRQSLKDGAARLGIKLTYLPFVVKAVVAALKEVPLVNSRLDESAGEIVLHDRYHIGVAVASPQGLFVPVVHDADQKSIWQIATELERLSNEVRTGKIRREDLRDGTFTITSIGGIGGLISTPVINYPEVGILGIGKIVKRPVYDATGNLRPADLVYLSFSFDHRVVDGAVGAVFGNAVIEQLRNPAAMLLTAQL